MVLRCTWSSGASFTCILALLACFLLSYSSTRGCGAAHAGGERGRGRGQPLKLIADQDSQAWNYDQRRYIRARLEELEAEAEAEAEALDALDIFEQLQRAVNNLSRNGGDPDEQRARYSDGQQEEEEEEEEEEEVVKERHPADALLRRHRADATVSYILGGY